MSHHDDGSSSSVNVGLGASPIIIENKGIRDRQQDQVSETGSGYFIFAKHLTSSASFDFFVDFNHS